MEKFHLVSQWAASINAEQAFKEINNLRQKYPWLRCEESFEFISKMHLDLPKMLHVIVLQEKQNAILRRSDENLRGYIKANQLADEVIIDDLRKKFNIDI
jgi:hypothetical protein